MKQRNKIYNSWLLTRPIAHRGLHSENLIPENSMAAFEKAVESNYPIELDIQILSDENIIVFHDENLKRLTGVEGMVGEQIFSNIKNLGLYQTDQKIPLIEDVLDYIDGRVPLLIEIKNVGRAGKFERKLFEKLVNYKDEFAVQSFNPFSMRWFKSNAGHIMRGQLSSDFRGEDLSFYKKFLIRRLLLNRISSPDFIAYDINSLPYKAVSAARKKGIPIIAWTIDNLQKFDKAKKYADNFIFEGIEPQI